MHLIEIYGGQCHLRVVSVFLSLFCFSFLSKLKVNAVVFNCNTTELVEFFYSDVIVSKMASDISKDFYF